MRVFDPSLAGTLILRRLAPSRCWYSFTYPGRMDSWVSLGGKESRTNQFKPWKSRGSNWGPCGWKAEILSTAPATPAQDCIAIKYKWNDFFWFILSIKYWAFTKNAYFQLKTRSQLKCHKIWYCISWHS